jgi:hypothetical protein
MVTMEVLTLIGLLCNLPSADATRSNTFSCYNNLVSCVAKNTPKSYIPANKDAVQDTTWVVECIKDFNIDLPKFRPWE